jgi:hypothetical protein
LDEKKSRYIVKPFGVFTFSINRTSTEVRSSKKRKMRLINLDEWKIEEGRKRGGEGEGKK